MDGKIDLLLLCALICLTLYFLKRERRLTAQIQSMLDDAAAGEFQEKHLDESPASLIENNLWRYLCDHEAKIRKLTEEKEQMQEQISDISHQAVIPISNIVLYAQLLEEWADTKRQESVPDPEEKKELRNGLAAIREQAGTLDFLIESLVKLSRLETGIINITIKKQPLQSVLNAVKNQFRAIALQKELQFEVADTEETAAFDLKWTIEAVANIVDNAVKYTPYGGKVTIRAVPYTSLVRVDVSDNGIGITEEEQAKVFLRFYRSETVSGRSGVGIGLYLAREVMKTQSGYIKLSSKAGEGSTFSLFFPKEEISQK